MSPRRMRKRVPAEELVFFVNIKIWAPFYNPIVSDIDPHNSLSRLVHCLNKRDWNDECVGSQTIYVHIIYV